MRTLVFCLTIYSLSAFSPTPKPSDYSPQKLNIKNRILVTVMNKPISVLDVVKKMNVMLEQSYPDYKNIPEAKYQFYSQQWRYVLRQMIDAELMLKDAEKLELKVTDAEVREEIHSRFGPNVMKSLKEIGISYDEAQKMIHTDIITQRMMWYRVHSKALSKVIPQDIKKSYQDYVYKNPSDNIWTYEVLSVKSNNDSSSSLVASKAFDMLCAAKLGLKEAATSLKTSSQNDNNLQITVSEVITAKEYELSSAHKDALKTLVKGQFSKPIEQIGKNGKDKAHRIYHLIDVQKKEPAKFVTLADQFKDKLIQDKVNEFNQNYISKLRSRYGFDDLSNIDKLEPFVLEQ
jgi:SurA N-terminal domain